MRAESSTRSDIKSDTRQLSATGQIPLAIDTPQRRARKPSTQTAPLAALAHTGTNRAHRTPA